MPQIPNPDYISTMGLDIRCTLQADTSKRFKCWFTLIKEFEDVPVMNICEHQFKEMDTFPNSDNFLFITSFNSFSDMEQFLHKINLTVLHSNVWWIV